MRALRKWGVFFLCENELDDIWLCRRCKYAASKRRRFKIIDIMRKGHASEYFVMSDLAMKDFIPCPATQSAAGFDLIAVKGNRVDKVQVKCGNRIGQKVKVDIRKSKAAGRKYTDEDFDILAVVDLTDWKIAYIPKEVIGDAVGLTLWINYPTSPNGFGPDRKPKLFEDYKEYPNLSAIGRRLDD